MKKEKALIRRKIHSFFVSEKGRTVKAEAEALQKNEKYCKRFLESIAFYKTARTIFAYNPLPEEFPTTGLLKKAYADGKIVALPVVSGKDLLFKKITIKNGNIIPLKKGGFGVFEPDETAQTLFPKPESACITDGIYFPLLVFIPGRAFTKDGKRLGFGGGFYDRFLQKLCSSPKKGKIKIIGLCFPEQVFESLPVEHGDMSVDFILP